MLVAIQNVNLQNVVEGCWWNNIEVWRPNHRSEKQTIRDDSLIGGPRTNTTRISAYSVWSIRSHGYVNTLTLAGAVLGYALTEYSETWTWSHNIQKEEKRFFLHSFPYTELWNISENVLKAVLFVHFGKFVRKIYFLVSCEILPHPFRVLTGSQYKTYR